MVLGVTGAFGCGKSAVIAAFAARGWRIADADRLCHELYADPESGVTRTLASRWGAGILNPEGAVDRRKLGGIVFADRAELDFLTGVLYPELSRKLDSQIDACRRDGADGAFELPLLYEAGWETKFDRVAAVWATPAVRYARLRDRRNFSDEEIRGREARQLSADVKLERADYALINNGSLRELEAQMARLIRYLEEDES